MVIKKLLKSALLLAATGAVVVGSTSAFFTSSVTAANNEIEVGTLRMAIDSTRTGTVAYTWNGGTGPFGGIFDSYTVVQDVNGVSTNYNTLKPWQNAEPGVAMPYSNDAGADVLPAGNHSWFVSIRNAGSIAMKASANVSNGTWTLDPGVAATPACSSFVPSSSVISVNNVTIYGTTGGANICKSHEECENIYYGLVSQGNAYSADADVSGADINITPTGTVYVTADGTSGADPIVLNQNEFVIARVDASFDTSSNCYQGATYTYDLNGNAYQLADGSW